MLTQSDLREMFEYDLYSGQLIWKNRCDRSPQWNGRYAGTIAGSKAYFEKSGPYWVINVDGRPQLAHRLILLLCYGTLPDYLDHIDHDGLNNKLNNLREATISQNNANRSKKAIGYELHGQKYRARIKVNDKQMVIGTYSTEREAREAYVAAALELFGKFASV